jgi:hypothetical protein
LGFVPSSWSDDVEALLVLLLFLLLRFLTGDFEGEEDAVLRLVAAGCFRLGEEALEGEADFRVGEA